MKMMISEQEVKSAGDVMKYCATHSHKREAMYTVLTRLPPPHYDNPDNNDDHNTG